MGNQQQSKNQLDNFIDYIDSLANTCEFISRDIDDEYYDMLEMALEYGMTPNQFWNDDIELFFCYQNAYYKKIHKEAHLQGLYNFIALKDCLNNMFAKNDSDIMYYPNEDFYTTEYNKQNGISKELSVQAKIKKGKEITRDNLEEQYRLRLSMCY